VTARESLFLATSPRSIAQTSWQQRLSEALEEKGLKGRFSRRPNRYRGYDEPETNHPSPVIRAFVRGGSFFGPHHVFLAEYWRRQVGSEELPLGFRAERLAKLIDEEKEET
jgi:hypothetical protein